MAVKDEWKKTGKGIGQSFKSLGKSIVKSVKVGAERLDGDNKEAEKTDLREAWSEVGHTFGDTGKHLGRAAAGTGKKVVDAVENSDDGEKSEPAEEPKEEEK